MQRKKLLRKLVRRPILEESFQVTALLLRQPRRRQEKKRSGTSLPFSEIPKNSSMPMQVTEGAQWSLASLEGTDSSFPEYGTTSQSNDVVAAWCRRNLEELGVAKEVKRVRDASPRTAISSRHTRDRSLRAVAAMAAFSGSLPEEVRRECSQFSASGINEAGQMEDPTNLHCGALQDRRRAQREKQRAREGGV